MGEAERVEDRRAVIRQSLVLAEWLEERIERTQERMIGATPGRFRFLRRRLAELILEKDVLIAAALTIQGRSVRGVQFTARRVMALLGLARRRRPTKLTPIRSQSPDRRAVPAPGRRGSSTGTNAPQTPAGSPTESPSGSSFPATGAAASH